jgi:pimeloyl-ACP methyl ester carboxylesterase
MTFGNKRWLASRMEELEKGSQVIQTARGAVEFKKYGAAPYLMLLHGTPGGYDQTLSAVDPFVEAGFGYISISRPGYLRTPLEVGRDFEEQADVFAALLDEIQVDKVVAYGISGGGPPAIQFSARHPDCSHALLLGSAATQAHSWNAPEWTDKLQLSSITPRLTIWMAEKFPKMATKAMLQAASTYNAAERKRAADMIAGSPKLLKLMNQLLNAGFPFGPRLAGYRNDLDLMASMEKLPFEDVQCPTLIAHGTADGDVPFSHAENAHASIPNSQLYKMENAWHLLWLSECADEMVQAQVEFAKKHSK